jgi:hypothetical protein
MKAVAVLVILLLGVLIGFQAATLWLLSDGSDDSNLRNYHNSNNSMLNHASALMQRVLTVTPQEVNGRSDVLHNLQQEQQLQEVAEPPDPQLW